MADYELKSDGVLRRSDGASIPDDPGNRDWRKYQRWVEAGNTPDPMPAEPPKPTPAESVKAMLATDPALGALIRKLAKDAGVTETKMIDDVAAEAVALGGTS